VLQYRTGQVREVEVRWIHRPVPTLSLERPRGYLVLPGWPVIERRLSDHGLRVEQLDQEQELMVQTMRIENLAREQTASYQGLTRMQADVRRRMERRRLPAGTLWARNGSR
jgi:hypothetical protein